MASDASHKTQDALAQPAQTDIKWIIRPMRQEDIDQCLSIWSKVELTEGHQTVSSTLASDPAGFYVAELESSGEVIGMCAAPMTRADTAFIGFYAVEPAYQRIGIGRELWSKTLARLDASINIGLYGVPSMSEKYKKSGFVVEDATRMLIFESERNGHDRSRLSQLKDIDEFAGCRLIVMDSQESNALFEQLVDYDQSVQRFSRKDLLQRYLRNEQRDIPLTLLAVRDLSATPDGCTEASSGRKSSCCARPVQAAIIEDEALSTSVQGNLNISPISTITTTTTSSSPTSDVAPTGDARCCTKAAQKTTGVEILGYGCVRHDNNGGAMIGPLYADSSDMCEVLLRNLMDRYELKPNKIWSVMALSSNKQACKILTRAGLREVEQCSRMFTKFVPAASFSKIYYVHSPNFTLF